MLHGWICLFCARTARIADRSSSGHVKFLHVLMTERNDDQWPEEDVPPVAILVTILAAVMCIVVVVLYISLT